MFDIADIQSVEHDVIIIGAGGAGLRAATVSYTHLTLPTNREV